jgi:hypothetical protein
LGLLRGLLGDAVILLCLIDLPIQTGQGLPSFGQSGLLLLLLLLSRGKLNMYLKKLLLRLEELVLKKGDLLPATLSCVNKATL